MLTNRKLQFSIRMAGLLMFGAALMAFTIGAVFSGEAQAQNASKCTLKTIKGTYLFEARGFVKDGEKVLPYAEAGTWTLDGAGNAQGVYSAGVDGAIIANQESFTATYQLKSGCIFTALAPVGDQIVEFHLYTTDQGATIAYFSPSVSGTQFKR